MKHRRSSLKLNLYILRLSLTTGKRHVEATSTLQLQLQGVAVAVIDLPFETLAICLHGNIYMEDFGATRQNIGEAGVAG